MKQIFFDQIKAGVADFEKRKGTDSCIIFPFVADLHSHLTDTAPRVCVRRLTADRSANEKSAKKTGF